MIGVIGDLHFKDSLGYADYIKDRRVPERDKILDFIVERFEIDKCDKIVLLGDNLNGRSNHPHVIKEFVSFLERFSGKELFILAGNHEKFGDGRSALDFLKEIKNPKWHIITNEVIGSVTKHANVGMSTDPSPPMLVFCPFFTKAELDTRDNDVARDKIMKMLPDGKILFHHHAVSQSSNESGMLTDLFPEPILPKEELNKKYKLVVGGHIHTPQVYDNILVTGSVFTNEVGEHEKFIYTLDEEAVDVTVEKYKVPARAIYKLENPTIEQLEKLKVDSIVKVIITNDETVKNIGPIKEALKRFDAFLILEKIPHKRKKLHYDEGEAMLEFSLDKLLEVYAKEKEIDLNRLQAGFELIR